MKQLTIGVCEILLNTCFAYFDDIIIFGKNFLNMHEMLDKGLDRFEQVNLNLRPYLVLIRKGVRFVF